MRNGKLRIHVYSSADKVDGQGVGSAYEEQVKLIAEKGSDLFDVAVNDWKKPCDIQHFHTIDPAFFVKLMDKKPVNVVYCHFLPDTVIEGSLKIPAPLQNFVSSYIIQFYMAADYVVVVNPSFAKDLVRFGIPAEKIKYIPNYVSQEIFHPQSEEVRLETRKKLDVDPDAFVVLGAGQVQTRKGVLDFIECAKRLPELTFVWAGGFSFGKMTDGYEQLSEIMKKPPANVRFTGIVPRNEMAQLYSAADVLFVPSYNELFPMTILEAANLHLPMVIRDLELYEDILFDHYLKGKDNDDFVRLLHALSQDPNLLTKYQGESQALSDFYSADHVLKMWRNFYTDAYIAKHRRRSGT